MEEPTNPEGFYDEVEIDEDLYAEVMARAALAGLSDEEILEEALRFFLADDEAAQDTATG